MGRTLTNAIPFGAPGKIAVGVALALGAGKFLDGTIQAAIVGFGVGMAVDGLLSLVLVSA